MPGMTNGETRCNVFLIKPKRQSNLWTCVTEKCAPCYAKHTKVPEKEDSVVNECNVLKNGRVCFSDNNDLWQINLLQYRKPQYPEYVNNRGCGTHTRDCEGCELSVVIPYAKHVTGREEKVEKVRE